MTGLRARWSSTSRRESPPTTSSAASGGIAGTKKVGHAGTLDPMATGVLVLGINKATRLLGHLMLAEKSYDADRPARARDQHRRRRGRGHRHRPRLRRVTTRRGPRRAGRLPGRPSSRSRRRVSAIKVGGKRAYKLAREGADVVLAAAHGHHPRARRHRRTPRGRLPRRRPLGLAAPAAPTSGPSPATSGARSGVGGHLTALRRTEVGPFALEDAQSLDELEQSGELDLIALADVGERLFFNVRVDDKVATDIAFGRRLEHGAPGEWSAGGHARPDGDLLALYEQQGADGPSRRSPYWPSRTPCGRLFPTTGRSDSTRT